MASRMLPGKKGQAGSSKKDMEVENETKARLEENRKNNRERNF